MKKLVIATIVILFTPAFMQLNEPILPVDYVKELGMGFDVTWSEFKRYMSLYSSQAVIDFA